MNKKPILQLQNIRYSYGSLKALDGIDFDLYPGEIHAITGDHGSGKSTLVQLIGGSRAGQKGIIKVGERELTSLNPSEASQLGISIVYQDQKILPYASVLDNVYLGRFPFFLFKYKKGMLLEQCKALFEKYGFNEDPLEKVYNLPSAKRQLLSIMRVLAKNSRIIILDEIAQKTTPEIQEHIYRLLRLCRRNNKGIIYVTSNIDELFKIADRATILHNGHRRGTEEINRVDHSRLVNLAFSFAIDSDEKEKTGNHEMLLMSRYDKRIINDIPQGLMVISPINEIQDINRSASSILSQESEKIKGKKIFDILDTLPLEKIQEIQEAIIQRKKRLWQKLNFEKSKLLKIRLSPLGEEYDTNQGVLLFIDDISSDFETREYLQQAEKFVSTAELAAGVAHEVNNPLGIIQNYLDLIQMEDLNSESLEYIHHIQSELSRIVEIISSLLSFSRVGVRPMHKLDLHTLLDEVLLLMSHKLKYKKIEVVRNFKTSSLIVEGHDNKLKQLFINLISNAIEAVLFHGKIEITTRIHHMNVHDEYAEITFTDNGNGIPDDILDQIFTPFYSTKLTKTNTGLGLSICQHIVESYNGIITAHSIPGEFTTFTIRLPRFVNKFHD
ncbi:MAG: ATP-binding cassette domain-containing protein [Spirochaetia bacterium]|nr:ATP-binding cassette domain-containing protein [Spirochaetia bacterium]